VNNPLAENRIVISAQFSSLPFVLRCPGSLWLSGRALVRRVHTPSTSRTLFFLRFVLSCCSVTIRYLCSLSKSMHAFCEVATTVELPRPNPLTRLLHAFPRALYHGQSVPSDLADTLTPVCCESVASSCVCLNTRSLGLFGFLFCLQTRLKTYTAFIHS